MFLGKFSEKAGNSPRFKEVQKFQEIPQDLRKFPVKVGIFPSF